MLRLLVGLHVDQRARLGIRRPEVDVPFPQRVASADPTFSIPSWGARGLKLLFDSSRANRTGLLPLVQTKNPCKPAHAAYAELVADKDATGLGSPKRQRRLDRLLGGFFVYALQLLWSGRQGGLTAYRLLCRRDFPPCHLPLPPPLLERPANTLGGCHV